MNARTTVYYGGRAFVMAHPSNSDCIFGVWNESKRFYEHDLIERVVQRAVPGLYMDVGANVGNHAVPFMALCPSTAVVCVEPFWRVHDALRENMHTHCAGKPWMLVPFAVGAATERVSVEGWREQNMGTGRAQANDEGDAWALPFNVLWDAVCADCPVAVLKLDVEGMELVALKQIEKRLAAPDAPRLIAAERVSPQEYADCDAYLRTFGYACDGVDLAKPYAPVYLWERTV